MSLGAGAAGRGRKSDVIDRVRRKFPNELSARLHRAGRAILLPSKSMRSHQGAIGSKPVAPAPGMTGCRANMSAGRIRGTQRSNCRLLPSAVRLERVTTKEVGRG